MHKTIRSNSSLSLIMLGPLGGLHSTEVELLFPTSSPVFQSQLCHDFFHFTSYFVKSRAKYIRTILGPLDPRWSISHTLPETCAGVTGFSCDLEQKPVLSKPAKVTGTFPQNTIRYLWVP